MFHLLFNVRACVRASAPTLGMEKEEEEKGPNVDAARAIKISYVTPRSTDEGKSIHTLG